MKLGSRIFICYLTVFIVCFSYPIHWMMQNLDARYRESVEEIMVDQATLLASRIATQQQHGQFDPQQLQNNFHQAQAQPLDARIYALHKTGVDTDFYLTDQQGRVIADSRQPSAIGDDYSNWRDVHLTLNGRYGARTTRRDPLDPTSSSLYVAAPILHAGKISGCLTLIKPTASINALIVQARPRILRAGAIALAVATLLSLICSSLLTRPIKRLTAYADSISKGQPADYPRLDHSEIGELGGAMRKMQTALEGKEYVEDYVQNLTHEIKSPLAAIRGAAELIDEQMPPEQRQRFLDNIRNETARIGRIVDTLLELAALENHRMQMDAEPVDPAQLLHNLIESKQPLLAQKRIVLEWRKPPHATLCGNAFLLQQALSNLLQNAIDFSPEAGKIEIDSRIADGLITILIRDQGTGIPDYAIDRVFEKFYSLRRPDSGRKSSGLGLNLVREVAAAHNGRVELRNRNTGGAEALLVLPLTEPIIPGQQIPPPSQNRKAGSPPPSPQGINVS